MVYLPGAYVVIGTYVRLITETGATTDTIDTISSYIAQDQQNLTTLQSEASEKVFDAVESVVLAEADFRFTLMFCPIVLQEYTAPSWSTLL